MGDSRGMRCKCINESPDAASRLASGGHMDAFRFMLKNSSNMAPSQNGSTLLMEAVDKNRPDFVSFLLQMPHGLAVDVTRQDQHGNNALFYAAAAGNLEIFKQLLQAGCPVVNDACRRNLLMQAVLHGHVQMVQFLVNNSKVLGIQLRQKDIDGRNLLFYCVEGGHLELLKPLVQLGNDLTFEADARGRSNLMQASRAGHGDIVLYLLDIAPEYGIDINAVDANGENAIFYAARAGALDIIKALLHAGVQLNSNKSGINVLPQCLSEEKWDIVHTILSCKTDLSIAINGKDIKGRTVLHHFVERDNLTMLTKLGSYYHEKHDMDLLGCSLLMLACKHALNINIPKYLLDDLKVDVSKVDIRKRSALFYAIESSNIPAVELLLERFSDVESDYNGLSVLHVAVATGNYVIVDALLTSKFGKQLVNKGDKYGRTELHYAALHGYTSLVELLISQNANRDAPDKQGLTPIMYTCIHNRYGALATLLRKHADPDMLDREGRNAIHHCLLSSNPSLRCVKLLVKYGVDVNVQDNTGQTALMTACEIHAETHISVIRFLVHHEADPVLQDTEGKDSFDHCPFNAEYVKALMRAKTEIDPHEQDTLNRFKEQLVEQIELTSVLRSLQQQNIFTRTLTFEVMKKPSKERVQRLLDLLFNRGNKAFRMFCKVLKETGLSELSYSMLKHAYRRTEEIYW